MNQERFDGLARSLATGRLTRWQVLKAFGAVAALGFLETLSPLRTPFAVAASCSDKNCTPDPEDDNNLCKSCTEVEKYIESTGVKDANKGAKDPATRYHQQHVGWTLGLWNVEVRSKETGPHKVASGACGKACKPGQKWCYKGTYKYKASVENKVSRIRWVPNPPVPKDCEKKCDKAINTWCKQVDAHEKHHVQDNKNIVAEANKGKTTFVDLTPKTFVGCANTKAGAKEAMLKKAHTYNNSLIGKLETESERRSKAFHRTRAGREIPPPCDSCKCGCGSNGVPCPPGQDCCNGQCLDTNSDSSNCGACGKACPPGESCNQGTCENNPGGTKPGGTKPGGTKPGGTKPGGTKPGCNVDSDCGPEGSCCKYRYNTAGGYYEAMCCNSKRELCAKDVGCTDCAGDPSTGNATQNCYNSAGNIYCCPPDYCCGPGGVWGCWPPEDC